MKTDKYRGYQTDCGLVVFYVPSTARSMGRKTQPNHNLFDILDICPFSYILV